MKILNYYYRNNVQNPHFMDFFKVKSHSKQKQDMGLLPCQVSNLQQPFYIVLQFLQSPLIYPFIEPFQETSEYKQYELSYRQSKLKSLDQGYLLIRSKARNLDPIPHMNTVLTQLAISFIKIYIYIYNRTFYTLDTQNFGELKQRVRVKLQILFPSAFVLAFIY